MKNEYTITKKQMKSFAKEYHLQGAASIILFVIYCVIGTMGLALLLMAVLFDGEWTTWYIACLCLVLAVYRLFFSRLVFWSTRYKVMARTYGVSEWVRCHEFAEDEIILTDHNSVAKLRYENIKKIKEMKNVVMVFFNDNMALRLYKDAFTEGSWRECKEMLESKMK